MNYKNFVDYIIDGQESNDFFDYKKKFIGNIENKLERMHVALQRQDKELDSWRERSVRVPNWIRNSGIALFITLIGQTMTAVWWASEITNTQINIQEENFPN